MPQKGDSLLKVDTPAKINLWLEVIRKRDDGYHELSSLMLPIGIYDSLEIGLNSGEGINLVCSGFEAPEDSGNLAWRAAQNFLTASGMDCGVEIRLRKSIPVGAGLGGGSSDAAAVLLGLNSLSGGRLSRERLHELAKGLGADVPFFLYRVASLATGIGEKLLRVGGLPRYGALLVKPSVSVSTAWVYRSLKLTRGQSRIKLRAFLDRPWRLPDVLENDLEAVTLEAYPLLSNIKEWLLENGALGALMSGSGPTVFGIYPNGNDARKVASSAVREWNECWVSAAETL